ncbi:MAG: hypothetical protein ACI87A_002437, partial [Planctomycetota bacterium]
VPVLRLKTKLIPLLYLRAESAFEALTCCQIDLGEGASRA